MSHLTDDDLVLLHYGEGDGPEAEVHVQGCFECRGRLDALRKLLASVDAPPVPSRPEDYGAQVWARLQPRLTESPATAPLRFFAPSLRAAAGFAALAASLVGAFLLGRHTAVGPQPLGPEVRERVLLVVLGEHLERSQMVLVELATAPLDQPLDVAAERVFAGDLVAANRLYRQSASRSGEAGIVSVLDELERVLLEVSSGPDRIAPADLAELQRRIESQGLLFKMQVVGSRVRERQKTASSPSGHAS